MHFHLPQIHDKYKMKFCNTCVSVVNNCIYIQVSLTEALIYSLLQLGNQLIHIAKFHFIFIMYLIYSLLQLGNQLIHIAKFHFIFIMYLIYGLLQLGNQLIHITKFHL